ncbi:helix-turn-helix domain-containing protein [Methyloceanibacter caenitepidi]|uniref:HTH cro/C1-type domain-containing protein n=1 Tax=Methyloceanibacter caenitepidi TaxID=1384459 RepID=A0A0A8K347_9HYPH|nr:helix-turn-helix transcriptional regulator [Methyloceanibacter caenitepidi]BAQ16952.1 hypothetical protein GL4_1496 [Methyloceanibacter caenitepidi]
MTPTEYRWAYAERVKQARKESGYTQDQMARLLRLTQPTYSKYESGRGEDAPSLLPQHLIQDFCLICRVNIEWLVTGEGPMKASRPSKERGNDAA